MKNLRQLAYDLLRKSERFFKTDMVYLAKGGLWLVLGQILGSLSALILAVAFTHYVPKEVYGNYKYILSLGAVLGAFSLTGVSSAVLQAVSKGYDGALKQGFWANLRWSALIILGAIATGLYYLWNGNKTLGISLFIIGAFSPLMNSALLYVSFLNGKKDFRSITTFGIWQDLIPVAAIISLIMWSDRVELIVLTYFAAHTLVALALYLYTLRRYQPHDRVHEESMKFSKHLSFMNILAVIGDKIDNILLFHFFGGSVLAIYAFATAAPNQIIAIFRNTGLLAIPKFASGDKNIIKRELPYKVLRFMGVLLVALVAYYFAAPYIYSALFPQYIESVPYSRLYAFVILFTAGAIPMSFLEANMAVKERYIIVTLSNIVRIILILILVQPFGIMGLIGAQIITKTLVLIVAMILSLRL